MSRLKNEIISELRDDARVEDCQLPSSVTCVSVPNEKFAEAARIMKKKSAFLAAEWATDETCFNNGFGIYACYRWGKEYLIIKTSTPYSEPAFPSITHEYVPAYRFERQIHSLFGIVPAGHPDLRPWIKFEDWEKDSWPLRKAFEASSPLRRVSGEYAWARAEGEGVYEIPVGPVHAGIIEPGHFRFQAVGENVLNLEERLGYVHKGIEKLFESMDWHEAVRLAGRVSGDSTVAHAIAFSIALESMSNCSISARSQWLRAIFLERERIANHLGDIGAVCNDAAFSFILYQMMRLKEIILRTNHELFGHRFIMDRVVPGGVKCDLDDEGKKAIVAELDMVSRDFERIVTIYDENSSIEDRVKNTGVLAPEKARELSVVGVVARSSGLNLDCRIFHPFHPYDIYHRLELDVPVKLSGDVHARLSVRIHEVLESIRIIKWLLENMPEGRIFSEVPPPAAGIAGFSAVEGWRGEIIYWLQSGADGKINRCMVRDPSAVNWLGLEQAMPGNIVPDFPLCNKSFNQSYSGHDL